MSTWSGTSCTCVGHPCDVTATTFWSWASFAPTSLIHSSWLSVAGLEDSTKSMNAWTSSTVSGSLRRKTRASRPWTVNFSWNLPLEVFDCFKVVALAPVAGGVVVRNTRAVHEIHITDMGKMKGLFLSLANKYRKGTIHESDVFLKKEKDGSFSQVIVTGDHPAKFTYSKNSEIMKISLRYGHYNRLGVPQHSLA